MELIGCRAQDTSATGCGGGPLHGEGEKYEREAHQKTTDELQHKLPIVREPAASLVHEIGRELQLSGEIPKCNLSLIGWSFERCGTE